MSTDESDEEYRPEGDVTPPQTSQAMDDWTTKGANEEDLAAIRAHAEVKLPI